MELRCANFSYPIGSFCVSAGRELRSYRLPCPSPPRFPCLRHPCPLSGHLSLFCFRRHSGCRCGGCCGDPCHHGGRDLCLRVGPGHRSDPRRYAGRSCRCGGDGHRRDDPGNPRVGPAGSLCVSGVRVEGCCAVSQLDWRARNSGSRRW